MYNIYIYIVVEKPDKTVGIVFDAFRFWKRITIRRYVLYWEMSAIEIYSFYKENVKKKKKKK